MTTDSSSVSLKIHSSNKPKKTNSTIPITHRPQTHINITLYDKLTKLGIPIIQNTLQTITNITKQANNETTSHVGIYSILCKDSNKNYFGKTQRNRKKRIYEHKWSIKTNDDENTLFSHMLELKHTFDFSKATLIKPIHWKTSWRLQEYIYIQREREMFD